MEYCLAPLRRCFAKQTIPSLSALGGAIFSAQIVDLLVLPWSPR
jgi:hypothetical protein